MANLFEAPIAATPLSEFSALPLDFIARTMQGRQTKYDEAKADMEAQEASLLNLKFLPGDRERHMELQEGYMTTMDTIVENAGGDYGAVQAPLDRLKREMLRDISYGELGAQQSNYTAAASKQEALNKRLEEGKMREGAMGLFTQSMQDHRTTPTESGGFSTFSGYNPATEMNPLGVMHDTIDEVVANYTKDGVESRSRDRINVGIDNLYRNNPEVVRAMKEEYRLQTDQPTQAGFNSWLAKTREGVIDAKQYEKDKTAAAKAAKGSDDFSDYQLVGVGRPSGAKGDLSMKDSSMMWAKALTNSTRKSDEFFASEDGQKLIKAMEYNTGTKVPTDPVDRVAWVNKYYNETSTINVPVSGDTSLVGGAVVDGRLRYSGHIIDETGKPVSPDKVMEGVDNQNKLVLTGMVPRGDFMGYAVISAPSGTYMQENTNPDFLRSESYQKHQLDNIARTATHSGTITLHGSAERPDGPVGTFQVEYDSATGKTHLYRGGIERYRYYTHNDFGPIIKKVNTDKPE